MLACQLSDRREPRWRRWRREELASEHGDQVVDGSCAMAFANLKHNRMIPAGTGARPASSRRANVRVAGSNRRES